MNQEGIKDKLREIVKGFENGKHPDFPIKKDWKPLSEMTDQDLIFDLPALVIYSEDIIGMIIRYGNLINGKSIIVASENCDGNVIHHSIDQSPKGEEPLYILIKKHYQITAP